ncbi:DivIVA domain-containing protein [Rhodococcus sp. HNM0569]|uniref:DivIVA domain-containing protein n=1 Tax=Rhodococcus sp. HNM0569 TaxID=2716340 RepID=UPI00146E589C|nr:DivIVA domain-containing protein [Rhodococcus sp. HNM0569]
MTISASDVRTVSFKSSSALRRGYDMNEVDDFLDEVALTLDELAAQRREPAPQGLQGGPRVAPGAQPAPQVIRPDTRADEHELEELRARAGEADELRARARDADGLRARVRDLEQELANRAQPAPAPMPSRGGADADVNALRARLDAAERENQRLREESEKDLMGISSRAVNLLSQAQHSADETIADAERYARELVLSARTQYQEILERAQQVAERGGQPTGDAGALPDAEYLRSCAELAQAQLHALLEALPPEQAARPAASRMLNL